MHNRSSIALCKLFSRNLFGRSAKCRTPVFSKPLTIPSHHSSKRIRHFCPPQSHIFQNFRAYSVGTDREVDNINLKFVEAREEIESAMDSKETVYFNEEAECARAAVSEVLEMYEGLLKKLPESEKSAIQRAMGLKIEQLKAELEQLND